MAAMNPEQLLKPLHWITGTWKSINATVNYPTMKSPINYKELLSFTNFGFLLLGYSSLTWNPETKALMHVEGGHLRIAEDGCTVSLLTSQNLGICTVEDGTVKDKYMELTASIISRSKFNKKKVCGITRCYTLNDKGQLEYKMMLQTDKVPLTDHLKVLYEKEKECK
ncbi:uncharacterized protein LOC130900451 [Diorhabda carinulata]|uniref:uncharacterized protein LOC130453262 n=1 Tax=Diorhabda sublineata TaxID=1163346 RepID=UPI0024E04E07|nr:uncharacterized protein LOC130453262 [Diorhabda sublineata]XP_057667066.1 uncharacterized protein LOC130900451 [Diorhabda carinulata]